MVETEPEEGKAPERLTSSAWPCRGLRRAYLAFNDYPRFGEMIPALDSDLVRCHLAGWESSLHDLWMGLEPQRSGCSCRVEPDLIPATCFLTVTMQLAMMSAA